MRDSYRKRMTNIDSIALPSSSRTRMKRLRRELKSDPLRKGELDNRYAEARRIYRAQLESGAELAADKQLRYYLTSINMRVWRYGLRSLPSSFNVTEAFFAYDEYLNLFRLLPESDYLVSSSDFFDFVTSPDTPNANLDAAYDFEDGVIHSFSILDDPRELMVETSGGNSYALIATSLIRRGDELCVMLTAGAAGTDLDELQAMVDHTADPDEGQWLKAVRPEASLKTGPVMLEQYPELLRVEAMARFNLRYRTIDARYVFLDGGSFFKVITDDDIMYALAERDNVDRDWDAQRQKGSEGIEQRAALFELMKTVVLLPAYLRAKVTLIDEESRPTKLSREAKNSSKAQREIKRVPERDRILIRRISSIRVLRSHISATVARSYTPPLFQVPVEGFWRRFSDIETIGHDAGGNETKGRTWVRGHTRYRNNPALDGVKIVYLKSSLASAKKRLNAWRRNHPVTIGGAASTRRDESGLPHSTSVAAVEAEASIIEPELPGAYVYVMRCPAHGTDIYKIGYSNKDPEIRARELSAATGSPVKFLVVQAWAVTDGRLAEAAAHAALETTRLTNNREFFQARYAELRTKLESAIVPWAIP